MPYLRDFDEIPPNTLDVLWLLPVRCTQLLAFGRHPPFECKMGAVTSGQYLWGPWV